MKNGCLIVRRSFLRRSALAAVGAFALPNLLVDRVYAGVAAIVDSSGDKRITLQNAALARAFDIGEWTKLRLGLRLMCTGTDTLTAVTPRFIMGLQSGEADMILDASNTNFIGARTAAATWNFANTTDDEMYTNSGGTSDMKVSKRVGGTWTDGSNMSSSYVAFRSTNSSTTKNHMMALEITKGDPNYTVQLLYNKEGATFTDVSRATFLSTMTASPFAAPEATHVLGTARTLAFDEVAGALNHIAIGWDRHEFAIQISDIAVAKINL